MADPRFTSEGMRFFGNCTILEKYAKTQFLCNSPQNIVDIMESGLTEPPDIELIHADEPPPPGSNLEIKMEMLAEDGCWESHIFPYANFWREIEFSMCSVPCEAFAYRFYFWYDYKDQEALNLQYINRRF